MNYGFTLCLCALHSHLLEGNSCPNVLSWVTFLPFLSGKLCTSKCLDKTIVPSWTRLYVVDHAENFSWQLLTTVDSSCCSLWKVPGLPWSWSSYIHLPLLWALHVLPLMPYIYSNNLDLFSNFPTFYVYQMGGHKSAFSNIVSLDPSNGRLKLTRFQ